MSDASDQFSAVSLDHPLQISQMAEEESYLRANSPLIWWASVAFAAIIGFSRLSYGLLLPLLQAHLHGSFSEYGLIGTGNFIGYVIGTIAVPIILTRYHNRVRLNTLSLVLMNFLPIASAFSFNLVQLGIWRFLIGLFSSPATVLTLSLALEHVQPQQRGLSSGLVWMGVPSGLLISGLIEPFISSMGLSFAWRFVWIAMGLIGLLATYGFLGLSIGATSSAPIFALAALCGMFYGMIQQRRQPVEQL